MSLLDRMVRLGVFFLVGSFSAVGVAVASDLPGYATTDVEPDVLIILDGSYAMNSENVDDPGGQLRSRQVVEALRTVLPNYEGIRFGLVVTSSTTFTLDWDWDDFSWIPRWNRRDRCDARWSNAQFSSLSFDDSCQAGTSTLTVDIGTDLNTLLNKLDSDSPDFLDIVDQSTLNCSRKDWEKAVSQTAMDVWARSVSGDPSRTCRKRAALMIVSGGLGGLQDLNGPIIELLDGRGLLNENFQCMDGTKTAVAEMLTYPRSFGAIDDIETYVLGFNLDNEQYTSNWDSLVEIANAGGTGALGPISARNVNEYAAILSDVLNRILSGEYSGTKPVLDNNYEHLYQAYFKIYDPAQDPDKHAWEGHLLDWALDGQGEVASSGEPRWDTADWLQSAGSGERDLFTSIVRADGSLDRIEFSVSNLQYLDELLAVDGTDVNCDGQTYDSIIAGGAPDTEAATARQNDASALIDIVRRDSSDTRFYVGCDSPYEIEPYRLLDIFRSTPRYVGLPSMATTDATYREVFVESQKLRHEFLLAGSNGGMLHAFEAKRNFAETLIESSAGQELWGYLPNHNLPRLKSIFNNFHTVMVDATATVADARYQLSSSSEPQWYTVGVIGDGYNGDEAECLEFIAGDVSKVYQCGHYTSVAVSASTSNLKEDVVPLWEFLGDFDLGQTLAPPTFGTVRFRTAPQIRDVVVLPGKGIFSNDLANASDADVNRCYSPVYVIQPITGAQIAKFALPYYDMEVSGNCDPTDPLPHGIRGQAVGIDATWDTLLDRLYVGDMDGRLWRLDLRDTSPDQWTAEAIFYPPTTATTASHTPLPMTYSPAATFDEQGDVRLFINVGDPVTIDLYGDPPAKGHLYALIDPGPEGQVTLATEFLGNGYIEFEAGEVAVGEPVIAAGTVFFTTYVMSTSDCDIGSGRLYALDYITGESTLEDPAGGDQTPDFIDLGQGIPSGVVLGINQIYVTMNDGSIDGSLDGSNLVNTGNLGVSVKTIEPVMPYGWVEVTGR